MENDEKKTEEPTEKGHKKPIDPMSQLNQIGCGPLNRLAINPFEAERFHDELRGQMVAGHLGYEPSIDAPGVMVKIPKTTIGKKIHSIGTNVVGLIKMAISPTEIIKMSLINDLQNGCVKATNIKAFEFLNVEIQREIINDILGMGSQHNARDVVTIISLVSSKTATNILGSEFDIYQALGILAEMTPHVTLRILKFWLENTKSQSLSRARNIAEIFRSNEYPELSPHIKYDRKTDTYSIPIIPQPDINDIRNSTKESAGAIISP